MSVFYFPLFISYLFLYERYVSQFKPSSITLTYTTARESDLEYEQTLLSAHPDFALFSDYITATTCQPMTVTSKDAAIYAHYSLHATKVSTYLDGGGGSGGGGLSRTMTRHELARYEVYKAYLE